MEGARLGDHALSRGVRLEIYDEIDSTNDEAKRRAEAGDAGPLWIVAARQIKGRGRLGRSWSSMSGNLHASLLVSGFGPAALAPQLGFAAGLATIGALIEATGAVDRLALKWPNDVLLDGEKLAGILLEGVQPAGQGAPFGCVIGIGVNCVAAPADLPYPACDLSRLGGPAAGALFALLSDKMAEALALWAGGSGFAALRERWLGHAAGLGAEIEARLPRETVSGRFETIDADGRLIISTRSGRRAIEAGDIFLPALAAARPEPERGR
ncbi:BirA family biotin operon repressor/biotin-[acetyl-CoA-carboxylase] ligase [Methylosinus sp. sav-2]|uniref:biotin--[acetyl-CoA-carboxylase] ligase n=1 Tax=Methylosinus sp. sav-2 TaxID=2485168 RepID=UPI00047CDBA2|nr:biotin--[acetyl-CoA-carboxylase] ligase [Methylosinus sp. sav-2]TDX60080.1 BirA family biotin operon repressor/biotin-[acetyl-CoA-carboxylase] ligase [Methylosinus sp. sav-2]